MVTPIYNDNRVCTACPLHKGCVGAVPGVGRVEQVKVMFIGGSPGIGEDRNGYPFKGRVGQYLDYLLKSIGLSASQVWFTNVVKCPTPPDYEITFEDMAECGHRWLDNELALVEPSIIVVMGQPAARYITKDSTLMLDKEHGVPRKVDGRIVLPMVGLGSALSQSRNMRFVQQDFAVLQQLIEGVDIKELVEEDKYPDVKYQEVTSVKEAMECLSQPYFALDTESVQGQDGNTEVWSVQTSSVPGTGYFIPVALFGHGDSLPTLKGIVEIPKTSQVIVHNYLYDAHFIDLPNPVDTMIAAYLLQMPMGLKELAYRLCGMGMHSYEEYVLPYRRDKALEYLRLTQAFIREVMVPQNPKAKNPKKFIPKMVGWPEPPLIQDWEWDNKEGKLVHKEKHPHNITKKILERVKKASEDTEYDPYTKWYDIDPRERAVVEDILGPMPDADLRDVPYDQAILYSTKDPDATIRVAQVLLPMIKEAGLSDVFNMEIGRC